MALKMKNTGDDMYLVRCYYDAPFVSDRRMRVQLEEMHDTHVVLSMRQPRSSKRVKRMISRDEFISFSYNEETGEVSFILPSTRQVVTEVIGTVEFDGGFVYVTDEEDGTVHIFHEEDVEIMAEGEKEERKSRRAKKDEKGKRRRSRNDEDDEDDDSGDDDYANEDEDDDSGDDDEDDDYANEDEDDDSGDDDEDDDSGDDRPSRRGRGRGKSRRGR